MTRGAALVVKLRGGFWMRLVSTGAQPLMPQMLVTSWTAAPCAPAEADGAANGIAAARPPHIAAPMTATIIAAAIGQRRMACPLAILTA